MDDRLLLRIDVALALPRVDDTIPKSDQYFWRLGGEVGFTCAGEDSSKRPLGRPAPSRPPKSSPPLFGAQRWLSIVQLPDYCELIASYHRTLLEIKNGC